MKILNLTDGQFSDLFFNYEHPEYDNLFQSIKNKTKEFLTQKEIRNAIQKDAANFISLYASGETVHELVEDFMNRV